VAHEAMLKIFLKRLLDLAIVLLGVSVLVFLMIRLIPVTPRR
jgi:ABC-type dipeptide/oligopeptide/nickel transport system permease component